MAIEVRRDRLGRPHERGRLGDLARLCDGLDGGRFLGRDTELVDDGVTSAVANRQANVFRGARVSRFESRASVSPFLGVPAPSSR